MNIHLFNILLSISLCTITTSTITNNQLIKDYTYYFETHRYNFHFDFDYDLSADNNIISNQDLNSNKIDISLDNIIINVLFFVNTSSYIFNINSNLSLNYDYDPDWNEIQTLVLTSPSKQNLNPTDNHNDYEYVPLDLNHINDEYTDNPSHSNMTSRRRLYQQSTKHGRFIGVKHPRQFHDAERVCRHRYGGELAAVRNSRENIQLYSLCKVLSRGRRRACWIGLRRPYKQWTDGRSVSYKKWSRGQPDNAGRKESCTEMWGGGRWNDNRCRVTSPFICETARIRKKNKFVAVGMALDWDNANEYCHRRFGTELATVTSSRHNSDVRTACNRVARRGSCWVGLERPFKKWQDGKRVRYKYWQRGEPNNAGTGESCTEIYHTRRWNDLPCRIGRFFVCNYKGTDNHNKRRTRRRSKSSKPYKWKGCYKDTGRRALRHGPHNWHYSVDKCYRTCKSKKYKYFALQAGSWCSCENSWSHATKYGRGGGCPRSRKGAGWRNDVFEIRSRRRKKRRRPSRRSKKRRKRKRSRPRSRTKRSRKRRRRRQERWKCSRLSFADYERKECLRRRKGMIRQFGRRRARRRWKRKMQRRGYSVRRMGRGFRSGYQAGKRSVIGRRGGGRRGGMGMGRGRRGRLRLPKLRMPKMVNGRIPSPPRIQLVDLPPHRRGRGRGRGGGGRGGRRRYGARVGHSNGGRRLRAGQLGTGFGMGETGHHRKYGMSTYALQAAMMQGASMKDLKRAAKLTDIGWKQMQSQQRDKRREEEDVGEGRRILVYDVDDADVYGYDDMENEKRCVLYGVYEVCVGYDFVEIKKYIRREEKSVGLMRSEVVDLRDGEFMQYIGYEYEKCKAMMDGGVGGGVYGINMDDDYKRSHYLNVYEFMYDGSGSVKAEQCFMNLEAFEICLSLNDRNEMIVRIGNADLEENGYNDKYSFNFEIDRDWNEIDEIIGNGEGKSIEKCVRLFEVKVCIHEKDSKFKMLLYKTA